MTMNTIRKEKTMATSINMSLFGLHYYDPTIFDDMVIPDQLDKDVLINNLILECAEMTILYPSADMMKKAIGYWSQMRIHAWERMQEVLYEKYDPFINIKRDELRTITQEPDLIDTGESISKVNAWNDGTGVERDRNNITNTRKGKVTTTETFHVEGDSAITDAQDVARKEMELRIKYDLYNYIVSDFKQRFCLQIY